RLHSLLQIKLRESNRDTSLLQRIPCQFCQSMDLCYCDTPLGGAAANAEWFGSIHTLAEKYNKTVAQLVLQWVSRETCCYPKSSKVERLRENFQIFNSLYRMRTWKRSKLSIASVVLISQRSSGA
ncbi:NADP-dependent D-sorbitol-6-phosphate dehydrogenase, partial [Ananas comosus]